MTNESTQAEGSTTPTFGDAPPIPQQATHDFTLQAVLEMQKSIGGLEEAVGELKTKTAENTKILSGVTTKMALAAGAVAVILLVGGFFLDKIWDELVILTDLARQIPQ